MHDEKMSGLDSLVEVGRNGLLDSFVVLGEGISMLLLVFAVFLNQTPRTSPLSLSLKISGDDLRTNIYILIHFK